MRLPQDPSGAVPGEPARPAGGRARRYGALLGATVAALASGALIYWIGVGENHAPRPGPTPSPKPATPAYAPARPDAEQVVRAYDQVQAIYAEQGASGVATFARSCADSLRTDPGMLDFCLAFDIYGSALGGEDETAKAWQAQAGARELGLARSVLPPRADPAVRLAEVRALANRIGPEAPAAGAAAPKAPEPAPGSVKAQGATSTAPAPAAKPRPASGAACRQRATPAQRAVCASPALREAERRLRLAYRRALDAGASPRKLARDQAHFRAAVDAAAPDRAAMARLYHRRTRALELLAGPSRRAAD